MRKITSKERETKKTRIKQIIGGSALVMVMLASLFSYALNRNASEETEKIKYNGIEFTKISGLWSTTIGNFKFYFRYNPKEVEKTEAELNYLNDYLGKPLYIYSEEEEATLEIYNNLFYQTSIVQRIQSACLEGEDCEGDIPEKNCTNNFIIIKESEENEIEQEENCVFIMGNKENLTKMTDSFLYKIIGLQ